MKKIAIAALAALALMTTACTTILPVQATASRGSKTGEAGPTLTLFGPAGTGIPLLTADVSLQTAKENGGISSVATIDSSVKQILFLYWTTTIVTGE